MQCCGHCLLYPAETPNVTASCNWWPHTMKPEVGPVCCGQMHSRWWCSLRPGADQSSKAAFGKSAFAKMCCLLLKIRLAHINRAKSKMLSSTFWHVLAESILFVARAKTCLKVLLLFAQLVCTSHIFNKRKHVRACFSKSAFAKSSFARLICTQP